MPDAASRAEGGRVLWVSSLDADHPGENVIDGREGSYWLSTGMYPQEILLALAYPCLISAVRLAATSVRAVRIEGCSEDTPVNFKALAEVELTDSQGLLQVEDLPCDQAPWQVEFLRVVILSGWHDFCSVHAVRVDAEPAEGSLPAADSLELRVRWSGAGTSHTMPAQRGWTVAEAKAALEAAIGIPRGEQRLLVGARELDDSEALASLAEGRVLEVSALRCQPQRVNWLAEVGDDGLSLRFATRELQADKEVVLAAVARDGDALQFASEELKGDRSVVLAAVRQKGTAVTWASEALQADQEVALAAVGQSANALQNVSEEMRADREVVLAAVRRKGSALRWASHDLRNDDEVIAAASENFYFTREELAQLRAAE
mmetsp:Transcript_38694/g.77946  ORF Transcript_38694/g.77946 Transcript_38694/m.77946 type:complete len:375 (-) Transcript_38694:126-1250(-)